MTTLSLQQRSILLVTLALLLAATRSHHWLTWANLPDMSWAVFFLAGFYAARFGGFVVLMLLAVLVDVAAVGVGGVSSYCMSPAYAMLIPAYASLWLAGRWFARRYSFAWRSVPLLMISASVGATLAELLSSGGFYFFSGRFADTSLAEFAQRFVLYFPDNLLSLLLYVCIAAVLHVAYRLVVGDQADRTAILAR